LLKHLDILNDEDHFRYIKPAKSLITILFLVFYIDFFANFIY
jgi:hypothetical protein